MTVITLPCVLGRSSIVCLVCWLIIFQPSPTTTLAQNTSFHRVFILGNTTELPLDHRFNSYLKSILQSSNMPATVINNGDFSDGMSNFHMDSLKLVQQISLVKGLDNANLIFIPGDRDWADSGPGGWDYVQRLERMVKSMDVPNVFWAIKKGCPGPKEIPLSRDIMLIAIQTQWWNHPYDKAIPADADCKISSEENFVEELQDLIEENGDKNILLAGHFPIRSYGPYGGKWPLKKYLLPIPLLSGWSPTYRSFVGTAKDISNYRFGPLKDELEEVLAEQHQLIYLSSHEYNLQVLRDRDHYLINSGSPINPGYTRKGKQALYAKSQAGLIELQYFNNGRTLAVIHGFQDNHLKEMQRIPLYSSNCEPERANIPQNSRLLICQDADTIVKQAGNHPDSITLAAGSEYQARKLKTFWFGKHYRDSWTTPVQIPYLNMDTTFQGLTPYQKGGGRQTTSLKLKANDGAEYVFRSVNKDPAKALDSEYRETVVGAVLRDQTSTQQPYGALVADKLLNRLDILHAHPKLYVLPESNKLGPFKKNYGGLLGMLEERPTNPKNVKKPFASADEIVKSYRMFRELYDDHDNRINTQEFLRARVFDLLVGDWGKHEDNWKWAGYEEPQGIIFRPIPRDRDHVFSLWDGVFPWLADREWAKSSASNFGYDFKGIRSLMWQGRHLDRFLANGASRKDWVDAANFIQNRISARDVELAVKSMPPGIYHSDGKTIEDKLNHRLTKLHQAASDYYDLLAKQVDVVGSNKRECFEVNRSADGTVEVTVCDLDKVNMNPDTSRMYYHRKFLPQETKEIRLYGLQKADYFHIFGEAQKSILIRVIGGPGADRIIDESVVAGAGKKTKIYEKSNGAELELGSEAKLVDHWDDDIYHYDRTAFTYNNYQPQLFISSSKDFGLGIKAGVSFTRQRFGKQDYSSKHTVQLAVSSENVKVLSYTGKLRHLKRRWDLYLNALAADHYYFTYFFGIGNDSEKDVDLFNQDYYRTTYNSYQLTAGLTHQFWEGNDSNFSFGLHYENNQEQINENTIIKDPEFPQDIAGAEDLNLLEVIFGLEFDFRDRSSLPERGMRGYAQHQSGILTSENNDHFGVSQGFLEGFITAYLSRPVTLGLRVGGSTTYGDPPFYKLKYLGQRNNLRGFLRNRFTGESTLFVNTELRWELSEFHTSWFPLRFGIRGFFDMGRVYSDYDLTNQWHQGYGGGLYLIPLKEEFSLNLSLAFSEEESGLFLLGLGKSF